MVERQNQISSHITVGKNKISVTQFMILLWGGILSPMMELLLPITSKVANYGAFLSPLIAIPFLLIAAYVMRELCEQTNQKGSTEGEINSYSQGISSCFCSFSGKVVLCIYGLWGIVLLALRLQLSALSFRSVGYKEGSLFFLLPVVALLVLWMAGSSFGGFARASTLFFWALMIMFVLVLGLSAPEVNITYVLPLWTQNLLPIFQSTVAVLGIFGYLIYGTFFLGDVAWVENPKINGRFWISWTITGCILLSLLIFIATGTFGASLLTDMSQPFFQLAKGVRIEGAFQRIESLTASIWTLADFILIGVLLRGTAYTFEKSLPALKNQYIMCVVMAIATLIALFFPMLQGYSDNLILIGNLCLGWILPLGLFFVKKVLHFPRKRDIMKTQNNS